MLRRITRPGMEGRESGLSGSPDIPDPPSDAPTDLRGRLARAAQAVRATMGAVPRVIGLVWAASRTLTFGLAIATIVAGVIPAITALVAKYLINAVVTAIALRANPALPDAVPIGPWTLNVTTAVVVLAVAQLVGLRPVVVPEHAPERLPAAAPGAGHEHDPAPDHGSRRDAWT